ncbi:MAG: hypothetical protein Q7K35_00910 [bacterium]|nr:hypothetical protein [bacterium]
MSPEIPKKARDELKEIYYNEFGRHLSDQEVLALGYKLLGLFSKIYKPIKS